MTSTCYASLQLCALRVSLLTTGGAPDTGANNGYVTDAMINLGVAVELTEGDEFEQKNGCGAICAAFKAPDRIKRLNLSTELCQLDMELIAMFDGSDVFSSGGNVIGMQYPAIDSNLERVLCVEAWSKAWDGAQQAVPAFTSPDAAYFHWVFPRTQWVQGDKTLENGLLTVPLTGQGFENDNITANGPFDDWPAPIVAAGGITRVGGVFLDDTLPTAACGSIPVPSLAS